VGHRLAGAAYERRVDERAVREGDGADVAPLGGGEPAHELAGLHDLVGGRQVGRLDDRELAGGSPTAPGVRARTGIVGSLRRCSPRLHRSRNRRPVHTVGGMTTHRSDFDFYVGTWKIRNRRLRQALAGSSEWYEFDATGRARMVLDGGGNIDEYEAPSEGLVGFTLRVYDPERDEWLLYWAGRTGGPLGAPQVGRIQTAAATSTPTTSGTASRSGSSTAGR
jgi:hypothetical protein